MEHLKNRKLNVIKNLIIHKRYILKPVEETYKSYRHYTIEASLNAQFGNEPLEAMNEFSLYECRKNINKYIEPILFKNIRDFKLVRSWITVKLFNKYELIY